MIRIKAEVLLSIGELLGRVSATTSFSKFGGPFEVKLASGGFGRPPKVVEVKPRPDLDLSLQKPLREFENACEQWASWATTMVENCNALSLRQSWKQAQRILDSVTAGWLPLNGLVRMIEDLYQRLLDELEDDIFLQIGVEQTSLFENPTAFGSEVFNAFGSANDDIFEASTCLALDRGTACVMHLSRVVEVGLRVLADTLGLPQRNDWGKHLDDIDKELTKRYKSSGTRTPDELFYSEAAAQIGHIKTAWRNPGMHVDKSYGPDRASDIFLAVKSFMRHLATRLHE